MQMKKYPYFYWIEKGLYDATEDKRGLKVVDWKVSDTGSILYKLMAEIVYQ